jgi:hypothetical protein
MKIKFTNTFGIDLDLPQPAYKLVPEWYKETKSYLTGNKIPDGAGGTTATIKRCMPVFDAMTAGYIITLPADVFVTLKDGSQYFEWSALDLIGFHPISQAEKHPEKNQYAYPKFINPWAIKTPKGYSCFFAQPMHRESIFTILPGIVDTDQYYATVNFPFVIKDSTFEGLIPKGTPIAQVIPFKRDRWELEIGKEEDIVAQLKLTQKLHLKFFDRYKNMFWTRKEFK